MNTGFSIPYVALSDERKKELEDVLRASNRVLKKHHDRMKKSMGLFRHCRTEFLGKIVKSKKDGCGVDVGGIFIPESDVSAIMQIKKVEWDLLCGFSGIISKIAVRWSKREFDSNLSLDDLKAEACQAAIQAITHFTKDEVRFSTFLHHCVSRHLAMVCNKTTGMSSLSSGTARIKRQYDQLATEEGSNFDSVVQKMNISEKQVSRLRAALCRVQNMTSLEGESGGKLEIADTECSEEKELDKRILGALDKIELSDLERAVLEGFMSSTNKRLGLGAVSKKMVNPSTKKPYSRMAFTLAWKRIKEKIEKAYGKAA